MAEQQFNQHRWFEIKSAGQDLGLWDRIKAAVEDGGLQYAHLLPGAEVSEVYTGRTKKSINTVKKMLGCSDSVVVKMLHQGSAPEAGLEVGSRPNKRAFSGSEPPPAKRQCLVRQCLVRQSPRYVEEEEEKEEGELQESKEEELPPAVIIMPPAVPIAPLQPVSSPEQSTFQPPLLVQPLISVPSSADPPAPILKLEDPESAVSPAEPPIPETATAALNSLDNLARIARPPSCLEHDAMDANLIIRDGSGRDLDLNLNIWALFQDAYSHLVQLNDIHGPISFALDFDWRDRDSGSEEQSSDSDSD